MKLLQSLFLIDLVSSCLYQATVAKLRALVAPIVKDDHTSLFSPKLNQNQQFLEDIASNILLSSCPTNHIPPISCLSNICNAANSYRPPLCRQYSKPPAINRLRRICHCTVVATDSVSRPLLLCFGTDLYQLHSFRHRRPQADYSLHRAPLRLRLCAEDSSDQIPLDFRRRYGRHYSRTRSNYINVKAIAINGALALNLPASHGLVKLSTVAPYTVLLDLSLPDFPRSFPHGRSNSISA